MESTELSDERYNSVEFCGVPVIPLKCMNRFSIDILSAQKILSLSFVLTEVLCCVVMGCDGVALSRSLSRILLKYSIAAALASWW